MGDIAAVIDPCRPDEGSRARLVERLDEAVASERGKALGDVDAGIDSGLEQIFIDVEAAVDDYLDWYFTVIGEYQRLAAVFASDAGAAMSERLEEYLFTRSDFAARLDRLEHDLEVLAGTTAVLGSQPIGEGIADAQHAESALVGSWRGG